MTARCEAKLIEDVKRQFSYDPNTGVITRLVDRANGKAGPVVSSPDNRGYLRIRCGDRRQIAQHRIAWLLMTGHWPTEEIDHINGIRTDNRWSNLRSVSRVENQHNRKLPTNNKSGVHGVCWHKSLGKWVAQIRLNEKIKHLGCFSSIDDAIEARKIAEKKYGYHDNHGRLRETKLEELL